jgi:hypothetical protein
MEYTLGQIVKEKLLNGRNGPYTTVAALSNLIKRKQLKSKKGKTAHGPCRLVSIEEIKRYNENITQKLNTK